MPDEVKKEDTVEGAEGAPAEPVQPAAPDLAAELEKARAQAHEYLDSWRRTAADLANYRKRVEREREEVARFSTAMLLTRLLPVLDDFERAMATLAPELSQLSWIGGVALIERKLSLILEEQGLKPIPAAGQPFDPAKHEALMREETTAFPDGQVIAELQKGYELHGRVLRPALVKVAVAPAAPAGATQAAREAPPAAPPEPPAGDEGQ